MNYIPFNLSCICKARFSTAAMLKIKHHRKINVEQEISMVVSKVQERNTRVNFFFQFVLRLPEWNRNKNEIKIFNIWEQNILRIKFKFLFFQCICIF